MMKPALAVLFLAVALPALAQQPNAANPFNGGSAPATSPSPQPQPQSRATAQGYASLQAAQQACGSDPVVWGNTRSHAYHTAEDKLFGKTKRGTYLCQAAAKQDGYHATGQSHRRGQTRPS